MPLVKRTRATLRSAELGFLGVTVRTTVQTPRLNGFCLSAGDFDLTLGVERPFLTNWLTVGIFSYSGNKKDPRSFDRGPLIRSFGLFVDPQNLRSHVSLRQKRRTHFAHGDYGMGPQAMSRAESRVISRPIVTKTPQMGLLRKPLLIRKLCRAWTPRLLCTGINT